MVRLVSTRASCNAAIINKEPTLRDSLECYFSDGGEGGVSCPKRGVGPPLEALGSSQPPANERIEKRANCRAQRFGPAEALRGVPVPEIQARQSLGLTDVLRFP
jgi:hypothetical protein